MPKDRSQMTPENPEDWAKIQSGRGQGTGGTGYDRLPGEQARPGLRDDDPASETVPEPIDSLVDELEDRASEPGTSRAEVERQQELAWEKREQTNAKDSSAPGGQDDELVRQLKALTSDASSLAKRAGGLAVATAASLYRRLQGSLPRRSKEQGGGI